MEAISYPPWTLFLPVCGFYLLLAIPSTEHLPPVMLVFLGTVLLVIAFLKMHYGFLLPSVAPAWAKSSFHLKHSAWLDILAGMVLLSIQFFVPTLALWCNRSFFYLVALFCIASVVDAIAGAKNSVVALVIAPVVLFLCFVLFVGALVILFFHVIPFRVLFVIATMVFSTFICACGFDKEDLQLHHHRALKFIRFTRSLNPDDRANLDVGFGLDAICGLWVVFSYDALASIFYVIIWCSLVGAIFFALRTSENQAVLGCPAHDVYASFRRPPFLVLRREQSLILAWHAPLAIALFWFLFPFFVSISGLIQGEQIFRLVSFLLLGSLAFLKTTSWKTWNVPQLADHLYVICCAECFCCIISWIVPFYAILGWIMTLIASSVVYIYYFGIQILMFQVQNVKVQALPLVFLPLGTFVLWFVFALLYQIAEEWGLVRTTTKLFAHAMKSMGPLVQKHLVALIGCCALLLLSGFVWIWRKYSLYRQAEGAAKAEALKQREREEARERREADEAREAARICVDILKAAAEPLDSFLRHISRFYHPSTGVWEDGTLPRRLLSACSSYQKYEPVGTGISAPCRDQIVQCLGTYLEKLIRQHNASPQQFLIFLREFLPPNEPIASPLNLNTALHRFHPDRIECKLVGDALTREIVRLRAR